MILFAAKTPESHGYFSFIILALFAFFHFDELCTKDYVLLSYVRYILQQSIFFWWWPGIEPPGSELSLRGLQQASCINET